MSLTSPTVMRPEDVRPDAPRRKRERSRRRPVLAVCAGVYLALIVLAAVFAPLIAPHGFAEQDYSNLLSGPSGQNLLGTDELGRDVLSRLLYGARLSLGSSAVAVVVGLILGLPVGLAAGFLGGMCDFIAMRVVDTLLSFPTIVLAICVTAVLGAGATNSMIAIGVVLSPSFARLIRGQVLSVRTRLYIDAVRSFGARPSWIIVRHVLPNTVQPVVVRTAHVVGAAILVEASLSFLGLGAPPPQPGWGSMLREASVTADGLSIQVLAPGLAIALTLLAVNILGDWIRDALDPRLPARPRTPRSAAGALP